MKRILLVYLPFCTPASPPYSITSLYSFLKNNCFESIKLDVLDLNLEFHKLKFPEYQQFFKNISKWSSTSNLDSYEKITNEYNQITMKVYSENNKKIIQGENPEFFSEIMNKIKEKIPDLVVFSIVYSSQSFYAYSLLKELKKQNIKTIIGGPAVNEKLKLFADKTLNNEVELLEFIQQNTQQDSVDSPVNNSVDHKTLNLNYALDFSIYSLDDYFTPFLVIPLRTSSTCFYKQCTFCSHYNKVPYNEFPLENIRQTILNSKQQFFFLIDDMIPTQRLLELAKMFNEIKLLTQSDIKWTCQLRPTKDLTYDVFKKLHESGLSQIMWGVESGNDRILTLMKKGTNRKDIEIVLRNSHNAGIKNITYIMFGFPTETEKEFMDTVEFIKENKEYIDLTSIAVFGLQKDTPVYNDPAAYNINEIVEEQRTVLGSRIRYKLYQGLTQEQAVKMKNRFKTVFRNINNYPDVMNFFREHMFCLGNNT